MSCPFDWRSTATPRLNSQRSPLVPDILPHMLALARLAARLPELIAYSLPGRYMPTQQPIEAWRMAQLDHVAELVNDHVIDRGDRRLHQLSV
jgi:hypothetical protein